jgi:hypothetical protein
MPMSIEPEEIIEARELLKEFEKAPGLLRKSSFAEGIRILKDFLAEHLDSKFSERVNNLKHTYTKFLISRLGTTPFSNLDDWAKTLAWVVTEFSKDEIERFQTDPELKDHWDNFVYYYRCLNK